MNSENEFLRADSSWLMMGFGLPQNNPKTPPGKGKTLLNATDNLYLAAIAWHAEILAVDPHASCTVINLKNSVAQSAKRVRDGPANADVLAGIATGVFGDVRNAGTRGTARHHEHRCNYHNCQYDLAVFAEH
jgi:hypothetical protein